MTTGPTNRTLLIAAAFLAAIGIMLLWPSGPSEQSNTARQGKEPTKVATTVDTTPVETPVSPKPATVQPTSSSSSTASIPDWREVARQFTENFGRTRGTRAAWMAGIRDLAYPSLTDRWRTSPLSEFPAGDPSPITVVDDFDRLVTFTAHYPDTGQAIAVRLEYDPHVGWAVSQVNIAMEGQLGD